MSSRPTLRSLRSMKWRRRCRVKGAFIFCSNLRKKQNSHNKRRRESMVSTQNKQMARKSTKNSTVLVVGATGVLGMEVCRQLAAAGKKVKGLVRTSSQREKINGLHELGVETVTGDMKDPQSLYQAFQNVEAIISTATSTISHQEGDSIETVDVAGQLNVAEAASAAGVQHVVFISFPPMTPEFPLQSAKRAVEHRLKSKNFTYTILQPTYFMEIWLSPALGFDYVRAKAIIYREGKNKISWIAITDVARFAVASIENPSAQNAVIQLGGPDDLSVLDAVEIFERESGQTFELQNVPDDALRAQMAATPDSLSKTFSGLMIGLNEVGRIDMKEALRNFPIQLTSVREYAKQMIAAETAVYLDLQIPKFLRMYFPQRWRPREAADIGGRSRGFGEDYLS